MNSVSQGNLHQLLADQYRVSMQQYNEQCAIVNGGYDELMKDEAESFERLKAEHERKMDAFAKFRNAQLDALKAQYAITE